ncbi:MAG: (deoxy)nucleoside triphosphate pyrophosphohydrolase [Candidatus Omnitrophica bacterium]|nr:(deoxy)nucleoside triphosphate pyrophosphohydrolase [Candidatus Omnitrophota bacterium]
MKTIKVVAALIKNNGKILLCKRKENDHFGLLWEFPGGKVERKETLKAAVEREIKEELELEVKPQRLVGEFFDEDKDLKIAVSLFVCKIINGKPKAKECADFGFFSIKEAKKLPLAPVDRKIIHYLTEV